MTFRPTRKHVLLALITLFAAVGLVDAILVHLKEIASLTDPNAFNSCKINSVLDCSTVARSQYSHIFGFPVSLFGILFYDAILVLTITLLAGFQIRPWQAWVITVIAGISLAFSYWLLYISYFGIGALCPYCLVSDFCSTVVSLSWFGYHLQLTRQASKH